VRDGDAVLLPYGYHPVAAPPGYRVYYLWALSGEVRRLTLYEDPDHRWIHDS
jgi:5-deoxy-glucuronate isomerase